MHNEHYIQNQIRLWCGEHDIKCFRCNVGKILTAQNTYFDTGLPEGFSDLLIFLRGGITIFCEVKTRTGRQREAQKRFEKEMTEFGFKYVVCRSLQDFQSFIQNYSNYS